MTQVSARRCARRSTVLLLALFAPLLTNFSAPLTTDVEKVQQERAAGAAREPGVAPAKLYKAGQALQGEVKTINDNGVIIRLNGVYPFLDGFAHISQLSTRYVGHPAEILDEGDEVTARVLRHSPGFLELTLREEGTKSFKDFKLNQQLEGTVLAVCRAGANVDVGAKDSAFLHVSCIQDDFAEDAREFLQKGDKVKVWVKRIDHKGMKLTMVESQKEKKAIAKGLQLANLVAGEELGGEVKAVKPFGAFVDVGAEADGLLKVRNVNDGLVNDLSKLLRRGDKLVVKVRGFYQKKLELELAQTLPRLPPVDNFPQAVLQPRERPYE
ncbi:unnamed protein product [Effrenium voratum]|uniref:S1 motif domain-containing protein n=1 Tax=Effrenium voratum TaxID=2562239 RepID=A0AA36N458_9DINO|nr:unnamed protein product [Effrenium voratum]